MAPDDSNWAGPGYNLPGPLEDRIEAAQNGGPTVGPREGDCALHMWGGPGHSAPFRGCPGDREAGG
jgi:hypothetical protein